MLNTLPFLQCDYRHQHPLCNHSSLPAGTVPSMGGNVNLNSPECHEISELVNTSVQQAVARLKYKLGIMTDTANTIVYTAISNTTDETALSGLESRLTSAIQGLLKPIQSQLDYHLPPPPSMTSAPPPTKGKTADDRVTMLHLTITGLWRLDLVSECTAT